MFHPHFMTLAQHGPHLSVKNCKSVLFQVQFVHASETSMEVISMNKSAITTKAPGWWLPKGAIGKITAGPTWKALRVFVNNLTKINIKLIIFMCSVWLSQQTAIIYLTDWSANGEAVFPVRYKRNLYIFRRWISGFKRPYVLISQMYVISDVHNKPRVILQQRNEEIRDKVPKKRMQRLVDISEETNRRKRENEKRYTRTTWRERSIWTFRSINSTVCDVTKEIGEWPKQLNNVIRLFWLAKMKKEVIRGNYSYWAQWWCFTAVALTIAAEL